MLTSTLCVLYKLLQRAPKRLQQVNNVPLSVLLGEENWHWWSCMHDPSRNVPWHKIDKSRKTAWSRKNSSGLLINNTTPVFAACWAFQFSTNSGTRPETGNESWRWFSSQEEFCRIVVREKKKWHIYSTICNSGEGNVEFLQFQNISQA